MNLLKNIQLFRPLSLATCSLFCIVLSSQPAFAQNQCAQASLVNPLAAVSPGIGGTGAPVEANRRDAGSNGGIGGTGMLAGKPGIGGTGNREGGVGGTGIVGVITGFASICVNGVEVHFDADTPVSENGQPGSARQLAVGQVVSIRANGVGTEVSASNIALIHAVVGPIDAINGATGEFSILGQRVQFNDAGRLSDLKPGTWVRVSGHRLAQGEIAASRIEPVPAQPQAQLTGTITRTDADSIMVEGTRVQFEAQQQSADLVPGREILISGQWNGRALVAQRVQSDPTRNGLGKVDHVVLEGYIHKLEGNQLSLGRGPLTLSPDVQIVGGSAKQLAVNQRVQLSGRVAADQSIKVDRIELSRRSDGGNRSKTKESESSDDKGSTSGKGSSERTESSESTETNSGSRNSGTSESSGRSESSGSSGSSGRSSGGSGK